jgi:2',3'-cyclic-nucleotide 2'-phosphodiesterase (5'-nucleotidase family)
MSSSDDPAAKRQKAADTGSDGGGGDPPAASRRVVLLATNDTHSQMEPDADGLGGIARRATYLKAARAAHSPDTVLLLDAGDAFMGSLYFTFFGGEVELAAMAALGYRAMAMGNHDFDRGGLPNLRAKLAAHAPGLDILCANVRTAGGGQVGINPNITFEKQLLVMIGNLV